MEVHGSSARGTKQAEWASTSSSFLIRCRAVATACASSRACTPASRTSDPPSPPSMEWAPTSSSEQAGPRRAEPRRGRSRTRGLPGETWCVLACVRGDSKAFGRPLAISYDSRGERNVHEVSFVRRRSHFTRSTEDLTDPIVSFTPDRPGDLQSRQARRALAQQLQRTRAPASLVAWATRRPHVAAGGVEPADRP